MPALDEAIAFTLTSLREKLAANAGLPSSRPNPAGSHYGYDAYAPTLARQWVIGQAQGAINADRAAQEASGVFYEALWELCRRGVLRPGVRSMATQGVNDGGGYSLTSQGAAWLAEAEDAQFIAVQPGALSDAFAAYKDKFGEAYHQRCQEALRCRAAEAWLAACAMAGAAAESILLAMAAAKTGNEDSVLRTYSGRDGRRATINLLAGSAPRQLAQALTSGMALLSYWRESTGHAQAAPVSAPETEQALRELLSLAQFAARHWGEFTGAAEEARAGEMRQAG